ncbi:MAG: Hpt domain-containing protein [Clostridia bacterium]|nr:Hpt domain-containing protein [Clostridia bacterium]
MLTIASLEELGVNTREGLERCLSNEQFYLRLVRKSMEDENCEKLRDALEKGDLDTAFTLAHTLKGVYGNLALTPLFTIVNEMTELLRARTQADYSAMTCELITKKNAIKALCE